MRALLLILALCAPVRAMEVAIGSSRTSADSSTLGGEWPLTCPSCAIPTVLPPVLGGEWFERVGWRDHAVNLAVGSMTSGPLWVFPAGPTQMTWAQHLGATRVWVHGFVVNDCALGVTPAASIANHLALRAQAAPTPVVFVREPHVSTDPACPTTYPNPAAVNACIDAVNVGLAANPPYVAHAVAGTAADYQHAVCPLLPGYCGGNAAYCDGLHGGEAYHAAIAAAVRTWVGLP